MTKHSLDYLPRHTQRPATCDVEVNGNVVIVTERPDNKGMSITNAIEDIALKVCEVFSISYLNLVLIEHYPERPGVCGEESFDLVTISKGVPKWRRITSEKAKKWFNAGYQVDLE